MSDTPNRSVLVATPVLAASRSLAIRATAWIERAGRQSLAGIERAVTRCRSRMRESGPLGWAGIGLLLGALIAAWSVVLPQREGIATLRETVVSSQHSAGATGADVASPRRRTAEFLRKLPTRRDVPAILGVVLQQAQATDLSLDNGRYEWRPGKEGGVGQYRIDLPVRATYPAIRQFIERTLAAAPPVALESLHFARDDVAEGAVDAEISFVIYLGDAG
jgi:hypothetical protein